MFVTLGISESDGWLAAIWRTIKLSYLTMSWYVMSYSTKYNNRTIYFRHNIIMQNSSIWYVKPLFINSIPPLSFDQFQRLSCQKVQTLSGCNFAVIGFLILDIFTLKSSLKVLSIIFGNSTSFVELIPKTVMLLIVKHSIKWAHVK